MSSDRPKDAQEPSAAIVVSSLERTFVGRRQWKPPFRRRAPTIALAGVNLRVAHGELVTVLGPNGAGKTTLLKILAGLVVPSKGTARVDGIDVVKDGAVARERIGYVLADERSFFWRLSNRENLRFFLALHGIFGARAARRIDEVASLVGLVAHLGRDFADLSTGQRQQMAIARGLLADPPVLLFDEATRSLDPGRALRLRRVIREVLVESQKKAILYATHSLEEAEALSTRVVLMAEGKIAAEGSFAEVSNRVREVFAREADEEEAEFQRFGHLATGVPS